MNLFVRAFLICLTCLIVVPAALAKKPAAPPAPSVAGVYENFTIGKGSGDLEGMRVVLVSAGNGHYAIVQIAQGGAEDPTPEFVPVTVKGMTVNFEAGGQKFTGTVTATGLRVKNADGTQNLKRKPCATYFR